VEHTKNINLNNVNVSWGHVKESHFTNGIEFNEFDGVKIIDCQSDSANEKANSASIKLENGEDYKIINPNSSIKASRFLLRSDVKNGFVK